MGAIKTFAKSDTQSIRGRCSSGKLLLIFIVAAAMLSALGGWGEAFNATSIIMSNGTTTNFTNVNSFLVNVSTYNRTWLDFDGINDNVSFPISNYISPAINFSVIIDFMPKGTLKSNLFSFTNGLSNRFAITYVNTTNNVTVSLYNGTNFLGARQGFVNMNQWNFLIYSYDASTKTGTLLINNVSYNAGTNPTTSATNTSNLGASGTNPFNGSIRFFEIYNTTISTTNGRSSNLYEHERNDEIRIPELHYHVVENGTPATLRIQLNNFTDQMAYLSANGFHNISMADYADYRNGLKVLPDKPFMLVFDDGGNTNLNAKTIMDNYSYVGTAAMITANIGKAGSLSLTNLTYLKNAGWEIASHTVNHTDMMTVDANNRSYQFNQSKIDLQNQLNITVRAFVFPSNSQNSTLQIECLTLNSAQIK